MSPVGGVRSLVALVLLPAAACGGSRSPSPSPAPVETITGRERLGWDQVARDSTELATLRYAMYVDNARLDLSDVRCETTPTGAGFPCSGPMPSLSPGIHTLAVAAFVTDDPTRESARSAAIRVTVTAAMAAYGSVQSATARPQPGQDTPRTSDGTPLRIDQLATGLMAPADAAFAPDGRLFVAEQRGTVRVISDSGLSPTPAVVVDDVASDSRAAILGIAIDPQFVQTRFVFLLHTAAATSGELVFRLSRFREVNDTLAERAVLLDGMPAPENATGALRFGPDGRMYAAMQDGRARGPLNGIVLRLNVDGTTPQDQAGSTPVFARDLESPRGLAWDPGSAMLWVAEAGAPRDSRVVEIERVPDLPVRATVRGRRRVPIDVSSIAFASGDALPDQKSALLIASEADRYLLKVEVSVDGTPGRTERLLEDRVGGIRVVLAGADGAIYFFTADAVGRLTPLR